MGYKIPLSIPVVKGNELEYVKDCLESGWVASGGFLDRFERDIRGYTGAKYAVSCVNGTCGLQVALRLVGVGPDDEVIVPTLTFIAPVNVIKYAGAYPVFLDCDDYMNLDAEKLDEFCRRECAVTRAGLRNKKTGRIIKAVIPVHIFGNPCNMSRIMDIARFCRLKVVEDAAESIGSYYTKGACKGRFAGTIGDVGVYSFNGNKIITSGGGGMIVTGDRKLAERARYLIAQAKDDNKRYIHKEVGYNFRLSNVQAAMGVAQLERLDEIIRIKRSNFEAYNRRIAGIDGLAMLKEPAYAFSNYWFYSLVVDRKSYGMSNLDLMAVLDKERIETRPVWILNHRQTIYKKDRAYRIEKAVKFFNTVLNLPCSPDLTDYDVGQVVKVIEKNAKNG